MQSGSIWSKGGNQSNAQPLKWLSCIFQLSNKPITVRVASMFSHAWHRLHVLGSISDWLFVNMRSFYWSIFFNILWREGNTARKVNISQTKFLKYMVRSPRLVQTRSHFYRWYFWRKFWKVSLEDHQDTRRFRKFERPRFLFISSRRNTHQTCPS